MTRTLVSFLGLGGPNRKANMKFRITQTTRIVVEKIPKENKYMNGAGYSKLVLLLNYLLICKGVTG